MAQDGEAAGLAHAHWVVRASAFTRFIGLTVEELRTGYCRTRLPARPELLNQGGTIHGGVFAVVADHTAGTAASTTVGEAERVVTAEYKLNILRPGACAALVTEGRVIKTGRRLVVGEAEVFGERSGEPDGKDGEGGEGGRGGRVLLAKSLFTFAVIPRPATGG